MYSLVNKYTCRTPVWVLTKEKYENSDKILFSEASKLHAKHVLKFEVTFSNEPQKAPIQHKAIRI